MKNRKPLTVHFLTGILTLKLSIIVLTIFIFFIAMDIDPNVRTYLTGFRDGTAIKHSLDMADPNYAFGQLMGKLLVPFILSILILVFVLMRKFWLVLFAILLEFFSGLGSGQGLPILTIIVLILTLTNPGRNYLRNLGQTNTILER